MVQKENDNIFSVCGYLMLSWKFSQTDIRDTDSYSDSYSLFQVIAHGNLLFIKDSYKISLSAT